MREEVEDETTRRLCLMPSPIVAGSEDASRRLLRRTKANENLTHTREDGVGGFKHRRTHLEMSRVVERDSRVVWLELPEKTPTQHLLIS
jgi:hypothetical protein